MSIGIDDFGILHESHVIDELDHVFRSRLGNLIGAPGAQSAGPAIQRGEEGIKILYDNAKKFYRI